METEFIIIVVSGIVVVVLIIIAYILSDPARAESCLGLTKSVIGSLRKKEEKESTKDTINTILDAAERLGNRKGAKMASRNGVAKPEAVEPVNKVTEKLPPSAKEKASIKNGAKKSIV